MQSFATPAPVTAVVEIPAGHVRFAATDRADTVVEIRPADASKSRDVKAADETTVAYADGVLRIEVPVKTQYFGSSGSVEVTVGLPAGSRVEAKAAAAALTTTGRLGDVSFDGAHGEITLDDVAGVRLTAHVGDVEIGRLDGPAEISVQKGDIRITEATRGTVALRTQAGAISVGAAAGVSATLDARTSHGRIDNRLKNNGDAELDIHATTAYGDITAHSI